MLIESTISDDVGGLVTATVAGFAASAAGFAPAGAAAGSLVGLALDVLLDGAHAARARLAIASIEAMRNPGIFMCLLLRMSKCWRIPTYPFKPVVRIPSLKYF